MSVLIKDMGKPKYCYAVIDGEFEYCPFVNTDDDCVLLLKKGICEGTWEEQYSKCPLVEAPQPCGDAVSRQYILDAMAEYFEEYANTDAEGNHSLKWCAMKEAEMVVKEAPPVKPEIIYCKDCKHYKAYEYTGRLACHYVIGGTVVRNPNDFCSRAERIKE